MAFELKKDLMTGNNLIDKEHAELLRIFNDFISSSSKGQEKQTIDTLQFLVNYVKTHFSHEEVLQKENNYPNYQRHAKIHRHLEDAVLNAKKEFDKTGFSYKLSAAVIVRVGGCIIAHIMSEDKDLAMYIEKNK